MSTIDSPTQRQSRLLSPIAAAAACILLTAGCSDDPGAAKPDPNDVATHKSTDWTSKPSITKHLLALADYGEDADPSVVTQLIEQKSKRRTVPGEPVAYLADGSLITMDLPDVGIQGTVMRVVDSRTGDVLAEDERYASEIYGAVEVSGNQIAAAAISVDGVNAFRVLDANLRPVRRVELEGRGLTEDADSNDRFTSYRAPALVPGTGAAYISKATFSGLGAGDADSDSVVRVDADGTIKELHRNRHVSDLTLASDGAALLAGIAASSPYAEGIPPTEDIVELDPGTGEIDRSLGLPPPCVKYSTTGPDESCLSSLDKVEGIVVAVLEVAKQGVDGAPTWSRSTWVYNGEWRELKDQRDKKVVWLANGDRLEQSIAPDLTTPEPVRWVHGGTSTDVEDTGGEQASQWIAWGTSAPRGLH